jgi:membrane associated rhomboid family serine protease
MKSFWRQPGAALTPGVRVLLILLTTVYLSAIAGKLTQTFDLAGWLAVIASRVWHGQVWRLVSYALLPAGIMDFLANAFALVVLGSQLERHWTRGELWLFCAIAATGAGLTQALLSPMPVTGATPMIFGLLIAWALVSGHEVLLFPIFGQMSVRRMVLILAAASFVIMLFTGGLARALAMVSGGATGWLYLWLRQKWLMTRPSRPVHSERMNRLEL